MNASDLIHMAIGVSTSQVVAHFLISEDCAEYYRKHGLLHVPYNLKNRDREPAPVVGSVYRA